MTSKDDELVEGPECPEDPVPDSGQHARMSPEAQAAAQKLQAQIIEAMTDTPMTASPRDWPEDFEHENGNYMCRCREELGGCGETFTGHKRRTMCKVCAGKKLMLDAMTETVQSGGDYGARMAQTDDVAEAVKFHRPPENVRVAEDIVCRLWKDAQNAGSVGVSRWGMRKIHDAFAEILASYEAQAAALSEHKAVLAELTAHAVSVGALDDDTSLWRRVAKMTGRDPDTGNEITRATALMEK